MPSPRRILLLAGVMLAAVYAWRAQVTPPEIPAAAPETAAQRTAGETLTDDAQADAPSSVALVGQVDEAFHDQRSNVMLTVTGTVDKVLADDRAGSPHQRFIVRAPSGLTVLVAHNIELAPRVAGIAVGDAISLRGEYEWNTKGGVVHWTHRDPDGPHEAGWIAHGGQRYQ